VYEMSAVSTGLVCAIIYKKHVENRLHYLSIM
jgi:hypothetical protein